MKEFRRTKESRGALNTDLYWESTRKFLDEFGKLTVACTTRSDLVERVTSMAQMEPALHYVNARSRFFQNRPRLGESYIQQAYLKLFGNAEREIIICNAYFIPSADFVDAVRDAISRGVRVIILTNSPETNDLPELNGNDIVASVPAKNPYRHVGVLKFIDSKSDIHPTYENQASNAI